MGSGVRREWMGMGLGALVGRVGRDKGGVEGTGVEVLGVGFWHGNGRACNIYEAGICLGWCFACGIWVYRYYGSISDRAVLLSRYNKFIAQELILYYGLQYTSNPKGHQGHFPNFSHCIY